MLKKSVTLMLFALLLCLGIMPASAADKQATIISVAGNGMATAEPDMAIIRFGISSRARTLSEAQENNKTNSEKLINILKTYGISTKDIATAYYDFRPLYEGDNKEKISAYFVNNVIQVTVKDASQAGKIMEAGLNNGANEIRSLEFSLKDEAALREKAMKNAILDARKKANLLAEGLSLQITGVGNVSESAGNIYNQDNMAQGMKILSSASSSPFNVFAGMLETTVIVHVDFLAE